MNQGGFSSATLDRHEAKMQLSIEGCQALCDGIQACMVQGLSANPATPPDLKMLPSFVTNFPNGGEEGSFVAMDLGGTNLRVLHVQLQPGRDATVRSKAFTVSSAIMTGPGQDLFAFLASCVAESLEELLGALPVDSLPLGFTFSFPAEQTALDRGTLVRWTKGFSASGVEGEDVVAALQRELDRRGVRVRVVALVNDTVGTLMAKKLSDQRAEVGIIFGTGTNACYIEQVKNVKKLQEQGAASRMCINMEWGNFGKTEANRRLLPRGSIDDKIDAESLNQGEQLLEKLIGGMYLSKIACEMFNELVADGGVPPVERLTPDVLSTEVMSSVEAMDKDRGCVIECMREKLGIAAATSQHAAALVRITRMVSTRAARVAAAAIVAMAWHAGYFVTDRDVVVALDGSIAKHYWTFKHRIQVCIRELAGDLSDKLILETADDGSGLGAAVIAATAGAAS